MSTTYLLRSCKSTFNTCMHDCEHLSFSFRFVFIFIVISYLSYVQMSYPYPSHPNQEIEVRKDASQCNAMQCQNKKNFLNLSLSFQLYILYIESKGRKKGRKEEGKEERNTRLFIYTQKNPHLMVLVRLESNRIESIEIQIQSIHSLTHCQSKVKRKKKFHAHLPEENKKGGEAGGGHHRIAFSLSF